MIAMYIKAISIFVCIVSICVSFWILSSYHFSSYKTRNTISNAYPSKRCVDILLEGNIITADQSTHGRFISTETVVIEHNLLDNE